MMTLHVFIKKLIPYVKRRVTRVFHYVKGRATNDVIPQLPQICVALQQNSLDSKSIATYRAYRPVLARRLQNASEQQLLSLTRAEGFVLAASWLGKNISRTEKDQTFVTGLADFMNPNHSRCDMPSLCLAMLYYKPYDLPWEKIVALHDALPGQEDALFIYRYIFDVYISYTYPGEADRHVQLVERALVWFAENLDKDPSIRALKLIQFGQAYGVSIPGINQANFRRILEAERSLLFRYNESRHPGLKRVGKDSFDAHQGKIKIGLLRYHYRGEIHFFAPFFALDPDRYEVYVIAWSNDGRAEFQAKYRGVKHHAIDRDDIVAGLESIRKLKLDIVVNASSMPGDFNSIAALLFHARLAKTQCMYVADIVTSGIPEMDYFVVGDVYDRPELYAELTEKVLSCPGIGYYMPVPLDVVTDKDAARRDLGVGAEEILFGSNAHVLKLGPDVLQVWLKILQAVPKSRLLLMPFNSSFLRARFARLFQETLTRMAADMDIDLSRIIISSAAGSKDVMTRLAASDIYLDTFP